MDHQRIKVLQYLNPQEIASHLDTVEYIMMATPAPATFPKTPIHFTLFLNTTDNFPQEIQETIFKTFCTQYRITHTAEFVGERGSVGFAHTEQETPMPMWLVKGEDRQNIPHTTLYVMDFLGQADGFEPVTQEQLTGWSYSYT